MPDLTDGGDHGVAVTGVPAVSVIMATHNGARTIRASLDSILSQTLGDLEVIVVDDCSTDATPEILRGIGDPRLRVVRNERNLNVVGSRNRALGLARGALIAMLDHDDLSLPTRLARQAAFFGAHPGTVLLGTATRTLEDGVLAPTIHPAITTPGVIEWLLRLSNPLVCSSVMFRADAARQLGVFMREEYRYADDFDLYHRMAALGTVARLDEKLTVYRLHASNTFKEHEGTMTGNAVKVLLPAYRPMFGEDAEAVARLVTRSLSAGGPVEDAASLKQLAGALGVITRPFLDPANADETTRRVVRQHAAVLWMRMLQASASGGGLPLQLLRDSTPAELELPRWRLHRVALNRVPGRGTVRDLVQRARPAQPPTWRPVARRFGHETLEPCLPAADAPPTLFVVVDTEAEFDWSKPFRRDLISTTAMDDIDRGQAIFDEYGLRPVYVVDYPVASQERGFRRLRSILDRGGCEIGAHLHPWTTPPFEEELSAGNSFPGNLDPALEERKLAHLVAMIRQNFGIDPLFYKAGRYGLGPHTHAALARHGIRVDFSVMAQADLRPLGGPDFSALEPVPYRVGELGLVTVPMTRARIGLAPGLVPVARRVHATGLGRAFRLPSILARTRMADDVTLTPEYVTAEEQIRLVRTLLARGVKTFVLHYHSPSLSPGHTQYATDPEGVENLLERMRRVCRFFFDEVGGLPGYPRDLLELCGPADEAVAG